MPKTYKITLSKGEVRMSAYVLLPSDKEAMQFKWIAEARGWKCHYVLVTTTPLDEFLGSFTKAIGE